MTHEAHIHEAQTKILRELLFLPETNFAELQKATGFDSDHAKFHIKRLVEVGYVEKQGPKYRLSVKGKEYANKLDTDANVIERQPKVAVMLVIERDNNGIKEYLLQQRRKHPYYGFWGSPTGKVRWGESISEAAERELKEETNLEGSFEHRGIMHERVQHAETREMVEDKIFHMMICRDARGELLVDFDGGRNVWRTMESMNDETKTYKSFFEEMDIAISGKTPFLEVMYEYGVDEF